jgi:hypothetical protein
VGTLQLDVRALADAEKRGGDYVTIRLAVAEVLKGTPAREFPVRFFATPPRTDRAAPKPSASEMRALNGKRRLVYLVRVDNPYDPDAHGLWLVDEYNGTAILEATPEAVASARAQIEQHRRWLGEPLPAAKPKIQQRVNALVEDLVTTPERQRKSLELLEGLGKPAVVAIVHAMDDRRALAWPHITLRNKFPGAFEAERHYGSKLVVDALAAILGQITGESFAFNPNGGSEAERAHCVAAWKLYSRHLGDH